jgi:hypothetical protein
MRTVRGHRKLRKEIKSAMTLEKGLVEGSHYGRPGGGGNSGRGRGSIEFRASSLLHALPDWVPWTLSTLTWVLQSPCCRTHREPSPNIPMCLLMHILWHVHSWDYQTGVLALCFELGSQHGNSLVVPADLSGGSLFVKCCNHVSYKGIYWGVLLLGFQFYGTLWLPNFLIWPIIWHARITYNPPNAWINCSL